MQHESFQSDPAFGRLLSEKEISTHLVTLLNKAFLLPQGEG